MHIFLLHLAAASRDGSIAFWFFVRDAPAWLLRLISVPISTSFFVLLSGFILTYVYTDRAGHLRTTALRFLLLRLTRILPVYMLSLLIAGPTYFLLKERTAAEAIGSTILALTVSQAWFPNHELWWNGPAWYFSVMLVTYLAFPFLTARLQTLGTGALVALLCGCFLLSVTPAFAYSSLDAHPPDAATGRGVSWLAVVKFNPLFWLPSFAAGAIGARLFLRSTDHVRSEPGTLSRSLPWNWMAEVSAALVGLIVWLAPERHYLILRQGLVAPLLLFLVVGLAHGRGPLARLLAWRGVRGFGESAFGIFALHMPLLTGVLRMARGPLGPDGTLYGHWSELILFLVGVPLVARACFAYYERPLIHRLRALF